MNEAYIRTVQLLLDIAPAVFETPVFAMKGGTALTRVSDWTHSRQRGFGAEAECYTWKPFGPLRV